MGNDTRLTKRIRRGALVRAVIGITLWPLVLVPPIARTVTSDSWNSATSALAILALAIIAYRGCGTPVAASVPRWERRVFLAAGTATAIDILVRAPHLDNDLTPSSAVLPAAAALLLAVVIVAQRRRHESSTILHWPLGPGAFQVVEGSGRVLNHHWVELSQREALDIVGSAVDGRSHRRLAPRQLADYAIFHQPVLAPAAGRVVESVDGLPDHPAARSDPAGNHVVIDTPAERIVLAHLAEGSVRVTRGDLVRVGDVIGLVGSSGNSSEPHLHIHATRRGQPLLLNFQGIAGPIRRNATIRIHQDKDVAVRAAPGRMA